MDTMTATIQPGESDYDSPYTRCPLCGSVSIQPYHRDFRGNAISRCAACKVQFMNPVYNDAYLIRYYARYIDSEAEDKATAVGHERTNRIKLRAIEKFVRPPGRLLDFGCGNGNFIKAAAAAGWDVVGYDVDCETTRRVAGRLNAEIVCGSLQSAPWAPATFDLVHAYHVMEHLKHPARDLGLLNRWLRPGGYVYVAVPNIESLAARVKFGLEKLGLRRRSIGRYYDSDHHLLYYSPRSMRNLLERCGFEILLEQPGNKVEIGDSAVQQFFSYTLRSRLYTGSTFFMIARKARDAEEV